MKKIINNPSDFVEESIQGLVISHPDIYSFASDNQRVIKRTNKAKNQVGIVSGGGSGHLPVFTGYVGKGMLDACAVGSVFASPSVDQIASAIRNGNNGSGVLCVLGNYGGDVMNFDNQIFRSYDGGLAKLDKDLKILKNTKLGSFDPAQLYSSKIIGNYIYFGITNFKDLNMVKVVDFNNNIVSSFDVGIIPGDFAYWELN